MSSGEFFTRLPVWIVLAGYFIGSAVFALAPKRRKWRSIARLAWTIGCVGLLAHVACAFHFYHGWSEESAYRETARQTAEVTGINWGGGLYVNYAVVLCWVIDVTTWWRRGLDAYDRRPTLLVVLWHAFLFFIIFNATVVFKTGPLRWVGVCISLALACLWLYSRRQDTSRFEME